MARMAPIHRKIMEGPLRIFPRLHIPHFLMLLLKSNNHLVQNKALGGKNIIPTLPGPFYVTFHESQKFGMCTPIISLILPKYISNTSSHPQHCPRLQ